MSAPAAPKTFHHGDLRNALIAAAGRLMAERSDWTFTLREVARAAGVSHNAPYNHFPDRRALLAAVATRAFEDFGSALAESVAEAGSASVADRIRASARAYIAFALRNASRFRLMFSAELAGCEEAALTRAGERAFAVLRGLIDEGVGNRTLSPNPGGTHALAAWSLVHGFATLILDGRVPKPSGDQALASMADAITTTLIAGLSSRAPRA